MPKNTPEKRIFSELLPDSQAFCRLTQGAQLHLFLWTLKCTDRYGGGLADPQDILRKIKAYRQKTPMQQIIQRHEELTAAGFIQTFRVRDDHPQFWGEEFSYIDFEKADTGYTQKFDYKTKTRYPGPETASPPPPDMLEVSGALPAKTPEFLPEKPQNVPSGPDAVPPTDNRGLIIDNRELIFDKGEEIDDSTDLPPVKKKKGEEKKETNTDTPAQTVYDEFFRKVSLGRHREGYQDEDQRDDLRTITATLDGATRLRGGADPPTPEELIQCIALYTARCNEESDGRPMKYRPHAKNYFNPKKDFITADIKDIREKAYEARQTDSDDDKDLGDQTEERVSDERQEQAQTLEEPAPPDSTDDSTDETSVKEEKTLPKYLLALLAPPREHEFTRKAYRLARSYWNKAKIHIQEETDEKDFANAFAPIVPLGAIHYDHHDSLPRLEIHLQKPGAAILRNVVQRIQTALDATTQFQHPILVKYHRITPEDNFKSIQEATA